MRHIISFGKYLKLRFPILPLILFTLATSAALFVFSNKWSDFNISVPGFGLIYLQFLFHMRILDEFKDFEFDSKNFKDRPLQAGIVNKTDLITYGILNFIIMVAIAFLILNNAGKILFIVAVLYSFLMFKEFFIRDFWKKSPVLYLITHQFVLVLVYLSYFLSVNTMDVVQSSYVKVIAYLGFIYNPILIIELGRKIKYRYDAAGRETSDTYGYLWGQRFTTNLISLITLLSVIVLLLVNFYEIWRYIVLLMILGSYYVYSYIDFQKFVKHSEKLTFCMALLLVSIAILS